MRVLVLSGDPGIPLFGPSGSSAHLRGVVRALVRAGHDVRVAVVGGTDRGTAVEDPVGVRVTSLQPRKRRWLPRRWRERGETWDARRVFSAAIGDGWTPDVVWERFSAFSNVDVGRAVRVLEVNAPVARERAAARRLYNPRYAGRIERSVLRDADRVVAVSAWLARWCVDAIGCRAERVLHVPNGTEDRGPGDRDAFRRAHGLDGPVLGFVGSMKPWHGLARLGAIVERLPGWTALVVGDGPVPVPVGPRVVAIGRLPPDALRHAVAAMDVAVAPYGADAPPWFCPLKVLDYRAQGVPVVAADLGDCGALVADGAGTIVRSDAIDAWADAILAASALPRVPRVRTWDDVVAEGLRGLRGA